MSMYTGNWLIRLRFFNICHHKLLARPNEAVTAKLPSVLNGAKMHFIPHEVNSSFVKWQIYVFSSNPALALVSSLLLWVVAHAADSCQPCEAEQTATGAATCFCSVTVGIISLRSGTSFTSLTAETSLLVFMCVSHLESSCSGGISGAQVALWAPGSRSVVGGGLHILTAQMGLQVANTWWHKLFPTSRLPLVSWTHAHVSRRSRALNPHAC